MSIANRPTLSDVAKLAGVSVATASRALSNPDLVAEGTRHAVRDAAQSCGYKVNLVARSLRMQRTNTILVLTPCIDNPFYPGLLRGIEDAAHDRGFSVIVGFTLKRPESCQPYSDLLSNGRVDGVVVIDGGTNMQGLTGPRPSVPAVQVLDMIYGPAVSAVRVDDHQVAELAVRHLAGLGHRRIAHISGAQESIAAVHRREGYLNTLAALGLPADERLIECGFYRREPAAEAMQKLLSLGMPPTAVFCANDTMATGALRACQDRGLRVPDHMSIVGAGNTFDGEITEPPLTTIHVPRHDIGMLAAERLIGLIKGQGSMPHDTVVPVELMTRGSTSSARAIAAA
ncbi:LacI family DNA-binding transcriptional regulator [Aestuariivirga sp.]|uniref:LacI family DNA-binding transcriptional regulator n=1 Tax=Aestuariivirga sp. TaxID=2650926 RepID=UPI0035936BDF